MSDRRRCALLAVLLAIAATAGCGVSETNRPVDLGDAAVAGSFSGGPPRVPPKPTDALSATHLVTLYLQAAVGDPKEALNRLREFFVPDATWEPTPALTVVRLIGEPSSRVRGSNTDVSVRLQTVGTLNSDGSFEVDAQPPRDEKFVVVPAGGAPNQWRLEKAPGVLMISDTTLEQLYAPSPVYFWNLDLERPRLVPDLRYVPLTIALERRLNQVVEWQLAGPSQWMASAVAFQTGVKLKEAVVPRSNGPIVVNLTSAAVSNKPEELRRLAEQLRWTLRTHLSGPLELQIEGQKQAESVGDGYLTANLAAESRDAALFGLDPRTRKVVSRSGPKPPPRVLEAKANARGVTYAGISAKPYNVAAFVNGRDELTIARVQGPDQERQRPAETRVAGLPPNVGRPVWIPESNDLFLVPAGGNLHVFRAGRQASPIRASPIPLTGIGRVDTVSVSPDGRRVALAAGGKAYVGALVVSKGPVPVKVAPQLRELVPGRMSVAAVAWTSESKVLVAGRPRTAGKAALFRATADGAIAVENSFEEAALTDVIAFPDRTGGPSGASYVVARTNDAVFYVFIREAEASTTVQPAPDLIDPFYAG